MQSLIGFIFIFGPFLFLILLGLFVGGWNERRHFEKLKGREQQTSDIFVTQIKTYPSAIPENAQPRMVIAEVVIAADYLKSFLAKLRNIFGGEVKSFFSLMDRARREALVRILEQAQQHGYNAVCNVRIQTADIGGNSTKRKAAMVAIIASGTAYHASQSSK